MSNRENELFNYLTGLNIWKIMISILQSFQRIGKILVMQMKYTISYLSKRESCTKMEMLFKYIACLSRKQYFHKQNKEFKQKL